jgi:hypothetical protein
LSDTDPDNDFLAWIYLENAFLALGDFPNAIAATNMMRQDFLREVSDTHHPVVIEGGADTASPADDTDATTSADQLTVELALREQPADRPENGGHHHSQQVIRNDNPDNETIPVSTTDSRPDESGFEDPLGNSTDQPNDAPTFETDEPGTFFTCDGCCFEGIPNKAPMWRCRYCNVIDGEAEHT